MSDFEHVDCKHCSNRFKSVICKTSSDHSKELELEKICSQFKKGETIFKEGHQAFGLYCINAGKIKLTKNGDMGRDQIVRMAASGDVLGYRSVLSGERYSASAVALEDSNLCFVPKELFLSIVRKDGELSMDMMRLLSEDLRRAESTITQIAQKSVRERTAEALLFLKETYGLAEDGETLNVSLSREELSNIVGTATETVVRFLKEFKDNGLVKLEGKKILLANVPELTRYANMYD
jgi:CRP/FNR family transcriptional regulator